MQGLRDGAAIPKELPTQAGRKVLDWAAIVDIAWRHTQGQQFPLVVDDEMQCEAVEPPHRGLPPRGYAFKDFVGGNPVVVTHGQRGGVDEGHPSTAPFAGGEIEQLLRSSRQNLSPVKRIDRSFLMPHEHATRALVKLMQIGKISSGTDPVFQYAPEAFDGIEVVSTPGWEYIQAKLLVPVRQRRRELMCPVDATTVNDHDHLFP